MELVFVALLLVIAIGCTLYLAAHSIDTNRKIDKEGGLTQLPTFEHGLVGKVERGIWELRSNFRRRPKKRNSLSRVASGAFGS